MKDKDDNISAMCEPAIGEAGKTGDWRDLRPIIDHSKCIPSVKNGRHVTFAGYTVLMES